MVKYGILGLLIERRGYGYDLVQRLSIRLGPAWDLSRSAVYAALDQLEGDGHVRSFIRGDSGRGSAPGSAPGVRRVERVIYEPTEHGVAEFHRWLAQPIARAEPVRSELYMKIATSGIDQLPELLDAIRQEEQVAQRRHGECLEATRMLAVHDQGEATTSWSAAGASLINAAATVRVEGELAWIRSARELLERISRTGEVALDDSASQT